MIRKLALLALLAFFLSGCAQKGPSGDIVVVSSTELPAEEPQLAEEIALQPANRVAPEKKITGLRVDFLKAGQAYATLVRTKDKVLLIDCGEFQMRNRIVEFLRKEQVQHIDLLLYTEPSGPNVGGCATVESEFSVGKKLDDALNTVVQYSNDAEGLAAHGPYVLEEGKVFLQFADGMKTQLIPSRVERGRILDEDTLVVKMVYGNSKTNNTVLLLHDCGTECQRRIREKDLRADVLQLAQHGGTDANGEKLLDQVQPSIAVISVALNNPKGLPRNELLQRLNQRQIKVYRTDVHDTVTMLSNGKEFIMDSEIPWRLERT